MRDLNEAIYHNQWKSKKNRRYQEMAMVIAERSLCRSRIPLSWACESYFFLKHINDKYGIKYSTRAYKGYAYPDFKETLKWLIINPILHLPKTIGKLWDNVFGEPNAYTKKYAPTIKSRVRETLLGDSYGQGGYLYGYQSLWRRAQAHIYNTVNKPQVELDQFKEKFGGVRVYFSAPKSIEKDIDKYIEKLELLLIRKGVHAKREKK